MDSIENTTQKRKRGRPPKNTNALNGSEILLQKSVIKNSVSRSKSASPQKAYKNNKATRNRTVSTCESIETESPNITSTDKSVSETSKTSSHDTPLKGVKNKIAVKRNKGIVAANKISVSITGKECDQKIGISNKKIVSENTQLSKKDVGNDCIAESTDSTDAINCEDKGGDNSSWSSEIDSSGGTKIILSRNVPQHRKQPWSSAELIDKSLQNTPLRIIGDSNSCMFDDRSMMDAEKVILVGQMQAALEERDAEKTIDLTLKTYPIANQESPMEIACDQRVKFPDVPKLSDVFENLRNAAQSQQSESVSDTSDEENTNSDNAVAFVKEADKDGFTTPEGKKVTVQMSESVPCTLNLTALNVENASYTSLEDITPMTPDQHNSSNEIKQNSSDKNRLALKSASGGLLLKTDDKGKPFKMECKLEKMKIMCSKIGKVVKLPRVSASKHANLVASLERATGVLLRPNVSLVRLEHLKVCHTCQKKESHKLNNTTSHPAPSSVKISRCQGVLKLFQETFAVKHSNELTEKLRKVKDRGKMKSNNEKKAFLDELEGEEYFQPDYEHEHDSSVSGSLSSSSSDSSCSVDSQMGLAERPNSQSFLKSGGVPQEGEDVDTAFMISKFLASTIIKSESHPRSSIELPVVQTDEESDLNKGQRDLNVVSNIGNIKEKLDVCEEQNSKSLQDDKNSLLSDLVGKKLNSSHQAIHPPKCCESGNQQEDLHNKIPSPNSKVPSSAENETALLPAEHKLIHANLSQSENTDWLVHFLKSMDNPLTGIVDEECATLRDVYAESDKLLTTPEVTPSVTETQPCPEHALCAETCETGKQTTCSDSIDDVHIDQTANISKMCPQKQLVLTNHPSNVGKYGASGEVNIGDISADERKLDLEHCKKDIHVPASDKKVKEKTKNTTQNEKKNVTVHKSKNKEKAVKSKVMSGEECDVKSKGDISKTASKTDTLGKPLHIAGNRGKITTSNVVGDKSTKKKCSAVDKDLKKEPSKKIVSGKNLKKVPVKINERDVHEEASMPLQNKVDISDKTGSKIKKKCEKDVTSSIKNETSVTSVELPISSETSTNKSTENVSIKRRKRNSSSTFNFLDCSEKVSTPVTTPVELNKGTPLDSSPDNLFPESADEKRRKRGWKSGASKSDRTNSGQKISLRRNQAKRGSVEELKCKQILDNTAFSPELKKSEKNNNSDAHLSCKNTDISEPANISDKCVTPSDCEKTVSNEKSESVEVSVEKVDYSLEAVTQTLQSESKTTLASKPACDQSDIVQQSLKRASERYRMNRASTELMTNMPGSWSEHSKQTNFLDNAGRPIPVFHNPPPVRRQDIKDNCLEVPPMVIGPCQNFEKLDLDTKCGKDKDTCSENKTTSKEKFRPKKLQWAEIKQLLEKDSSRGTIVVSIDKLTKMYPDVVTSTLLTLKKKLDVFVQKKLHEKEIVKKSVQSPISTKTTTKNAQMDHATPEKAVKTPTPKTPDSTNTSPAKTIKKEPASFLHNQLRNIDHTTTTPDGELTNITKNINTPEKSTQPHLVRGTFVSDVQQIDKGPDMDDPTPSVADLIDREQCFDAIAGIVTHEKTSLNSQMSDGISNSPAKLMETRGNSLQLSKHKLNKRIKREVRNDNNTGNNRMTSGYISKKVLKENEHNKLLKSTTSMLPMRNVEKSFDRVQTEVHNQTSMVGDKAENPQDKVKKMKETEAVTKKQFSSSLKKLMMLKDYKSLAPLYHSYVHNSHESLDNHIGEIADVFLHESRFNISTRIKMFLDSLNAILKNNGQKGLSERDVLNMKNIGRELFDRFKEKNQWLHISSVLDVLKDFNIFVNLRPFEQLCLRLRKEIQAKNLRWSYEEMVKAGWFFSRWNCSAEEKWMQHSLIVHLLHSSCLTSTNKESLFMKIAYQILHVLLNTQYKGRDKELNRPFLVSMQGCLDNDDLDAATKHYELFLSFPGQLEIDSSILIHYLQILDQQTQSSDNYLTDAIHVARHAICVGLFPSHVLPKVGQPKAILWSCLLQNEMKLSLFVFFQDMMQFLVKHQLPYNHTSAELIVKTMPESSLTSKVFKERKVGFTDTLDRIVRITGELGLTFINEKFSRETSTMSFLLDSNQVDKFFCSMRQDRHIKLLRKDLPVEILNHKGQTKMKELDLDHTQLNLPKLQNEPAHTPVFKTNQPPVIPSGNSRRDHFPSKHFTAQKYGSNAETQPASWKYDGDANEASKPDVKPKSLLDLPLPKLKPGQTFPLLNVGPLEDEGSYEHVSFKTDQSKWNVIPKKERDFTQSTNSSHSPNNVICEDVQDNMFASLNSNVSRSDNYRDKVPNIDSQKSYNKQHMTVPFVPPTDKLPVNLPYRQEYGNVTVDRPMGMSTSSGQGLRPVDSGPALGPVGISMNMAPPLDVPVSMTLPPGLAERPFNIEPHLSSAGMPMNAPPIMNHPPYPPPSAVGGVCNNDRRLPSQPYYTPRPGAISEHGQSEPLQQHVRKRGYPGQKTDNFQHQLKAPRFEEVDNFHEKKTKDFITNVVRSELLSGSQAYGLSKDDIPQYTDIIATSFFNVQKLKKNKFELEQDLAVKVRKYVAQQIELLT